MAFTFPTSGLTNGQVFVTPAGVAYTYNSTNNSWAPGFTRSQLVNQNFVATAGQTVFTVLGGYVPTFIDVYWKGSKLPASDFTATNGTTITLVNQCEANDDVQVRSLAQFTLANMVQKNSAGGDTMDNVVIGGIKPAAATTTNLTTGPIIASSMNGGQLAGFRNKLINGAFQVDQRFEGSSVITGAGSGYGVDRWIYQTSQASKLTIAQATGFNATNYGIPFTTSINIASSSTTYTPVAADYFQIQQPIEAINTQDFMWGTSSAKSVTLSFYCATSLPGIYAGRVSSGGSGNNYSYVFTFNATGAATYVNITIPGCTVGTPYTGVAAGSVSVCFDFGGGSSRQTTNTNTWISGDYSCTPTSVKLVSNASAQMYITGVQLEIGTKATPFEFRSYGTELLLCQRYFEKSYSIGTKPGTVTNTGAWQWQTNYSNASYAPTAFVQNLYFKVSKMVPATATRYSPNSGAAGVNYDAQNNADTSTGGLGADTNRLVWTFSPTATNAVLVGFIHWTAAAEL